MNKLVGWALLLCGIAAIVLGLYHLIFTEEVFIPGCISYMVIGALVCIGGVLQLKEEKEPWGD